MNIRKLLNPHKSRIKPMLNSVEDSFDSMLNVLEWIEESSGLPLPNKKLGYQSIVRGETDGTMGMEIVKQLLNWNPDATLILSGGVYGREKSIGDIGAIDLYKHIELDLSLYGYKSEDIKKRTIIDSHSRHTIDQGRMIAGILKAIDCKDVIFILPKYHMPRFLLVISSVLQQLSFKPNIIPKPYGDWITLHPRKGLVDDKEHRYNYLQLFSSPPTPSRFNGKLDCGEIDKIVESISSGVAINFDEFSNWYF